MKKPVDIIGASCAFPSGPTLPLADCALRAQLALPGRHPCYVDSCGHRVTVNYFQDSGFGFDATRWCALAHLVLDELADYLAEHRPHRQRCRLWLVLPRTRRGGVPTDLAEQLSATAQYGRFAWDQIKTVRGEHATGVHAIREASESARSDGVLAVVLAVDSWLHPEVLKSLEDAQLLHGARSRYKHQQRPNPYGRVPGEGAAAVAIAAQGPEKTGTDKLNAPAWATLAGMALAQETILAGATEPCLGLGLTMAAQEALETARSPAGSVGHVSTDMNGEPYRADEFGFTSLRLADALAPDWRRTTPALVSGDLGTASSIARLAMSAYQIRNRPDAAAPRHLVLCSSDDSLRAAMVLDNPVNPYTP